VEDDESRGAGTLRPEFGKRGERLARIVALVALGFATVNCFAVRQPRQTGALPLRRDTAPES
jgi:hypothetical protein